MSDKGVTRGRGRRPVAAAGTDPIAPVKRDDGWEELPPAANEDQIQASKSWIAEARRALIKAKNR